MDFSNRNVQSQTSAPGARSAAASGGGLSQSSGGGNSKGKGRNNKLTRIITVLAVVVVAALIIGIILAIVGSNNNDNNKPESNYVETNKLQAVFLNTGQVYFGHIKSLNSNYFVITNIYYLQATSNGSSSSSSDKSSNVTLVKLGCELHEPYDQMVINSDQVTFWENLQDNGQVAKAVSQFQKQNPEGQKCADQSSSASTNSGSNAQNANSNSTDSNANSGTNKP